MTRQLETFKYKNHTISLSLPESVDVDKTNKYRIKFATRKIITNDGHDLAREYDYDWVEDGVWLKWGGTKGWEHLCRTDLDEFLKIIEYDEPVQYVFHIDELGDSDPLKAFKTIEKATLRNIDSILVSLEQRLRGLSANSFPELQADAMDVYEQLNSLYEQANDDSLLEYIRRVKTILSVLTDYLEGQPDLEPLERKAYATYTRIFR